MLSDNIEALMGGFEKYLDTGAVFEPPAVLEVCAALRAFAEEARRLEAVLTAPRALAGNVIDLLSRRRTTTAPPPSPTGGDAA